MKPIEIVTVALVLVSAIARAQQTAAHGFLPYQNPELPREQRITDLLQRMTLEEKLAMLGTDPTCRGWESSGQIMSQDSMLARPVS